MKYIKIIIPFIALAFLVSCAKSNFIDLSVFTYNFNSQSETELNIEDFSFVLNESETEYSVVIDNMLLNITADSKGKINRIKLLISKIDDNGNKKAITQNEAHLFYNLMADCVSAFCYFSKDDSFALLDEFSLSSAETFNQTGELCKDTDSFRLVYYSTELMSEMIVYNTALKETESTEKPESKPYFADIPSVRTETVPLK